MTIHEHLGIDSGIFKKGIAFRPSFASYCGVLTSPIACSVAVDADILTSLEDCVTTMISPEQLLLATNRGDMYAQRRHKACVAHAGQ